VELRPNRIKRKLVKGEIAFIAAGLTHADDIDAFGPAANAAGIDGLWLEGEHGGVDAADLGNLTRACDLWGLTSVTRINANDQGLIYRTFDRGAQGIVIPHVNTRAEAENVVEGGKFAPIGKRGMYTSRQGYGVGDYFKRANDETLLIVLIEDIIAVENLDEILKVDNIDVFFVAPSDLATSMGYIGDNGNAKVQKTIDGALARIQKAGRTAGTLASNDSVSKYAAAGVKCFLGNVGPWIATGAGQFTSNAGRAGK